ncbi:MAG TPA: beta-ketoacyl synthase N-terminal-like domain-containing protein [Streptosporangiaceae bacterium]|nr:beta-ketoacyl synthase N-terminal-like domain-containing protein [Streptosporangiaceae bacterium]
MRNIASRPDGPRGRPRRKAEPGQIVITGLGVSTAFGRGEDRLLDGLASGQPAFRPASRFDTGGCRATMAAELAGEPKLGAEIAAVTDQACQRAGLDAVSRAEADFLLALHTDSDRARDPEASDVIGAVPAEVAAATGLPYPARIYTTACVAGSTAVADAATMIGAGRASQVIVAAGFLVDADSFRLFDAGRTLAVDGQVRPFSSGRKGMLLGDGIAAVVVESAQAASRRGAEVLALMTGWGRAGDAFHVVQPHPDGTGLARAITAALGRGKVAPAEVGYINANGSGTAFADASESAAIHRAFEAAAGSVPVSSTKSLHGHALEASSLIELVVTVLALQAGLLPVNAGFLADDPACQLSLVLGTSRQARPRYALCLNAAFGGASTALLLAAA